jgi:hypothetical protein
MKAAAKARATAKRPAAAARKKAEEEQLRRVWATPRGWRYWTSVNNTQVGLWYGGTAFAFMLFAAGINAAGNSVEERPQRMRPDGVAYPVDGIPGLTSVTRRPNRNTIRAEAKREDGSLAGEGTYIVSGDGKTMTATTQGVDSQSRPFTQQTVWDRT